MMMICIISICGTKYLESTINANDSALLVFPGKIHSEPHEQISWAEFQYVIDDYGGLVNPHLENALFGMDIPTHNNGRIAGGFSILDDQNSDDIPFDDHYLEVVQSEAFDVLDWEIPDASTLIHPIYFAKCLTKSTISLQDFQDAEPDFLYKIYVERFNERGIRCDVALKALCKRKGLQVEGAHLMGVIRSKQHII
ncbi:hypothetical protein RchiOBHm_Chr1g0338021 [Rosa chinensis]|uniref:Uncharacterized protein n=1 Tax=Rosa chinensis TaxID=74649 RepID=A0A2P6SD38_ROSCH|nr:hypothetical protein RchiOBHm_Chr1g0338021 [Rosa chinensis]